jgi:hypothetical protein
VQGAGAERTFAIGIGGASDRGDDAGIAAARAEFVQRGRLLAKSAADDRRLKDGAEGVVIVEAQPARQPQTAGAPRSRYAGTMQPGKYAHLRARVSFSSSHVSYRPVSGRRPFRRERCNSTCRCRHIAARRMLRRSPCTWSGRCRRPDPWG